MKQASSSLTPEKESRGQRGVVAVELAIILPLFGILLLGIIEVGSLARDHQVLQNAAREGARFSSLPANRTDQPDGATVETMIKNQIVAYLALEGLTVPIGNITVNQGYEMAYGGITIPASEITIIYDRPALFPRITTWFTLSRNIRGRAVFRNFY